jgi:type IV secretion system protein VirB8
MKRLGSKRDSAPVDAFLARPVAADPKLLDAYFAKVASYEASERTRDQRVARTGFVIGVIGCLIGVLGVGSTAALAPLKQVYPLVFRVDQASGAVERIYDVHGGGMDVGEAEKRYFLWQYVRYRQSYTAAEAAMNFNSVALLSSSDVQQAYAAVFKGTNPNSPQVLLGRDGTATVRWISTSFLGPTLAQVRFVQMGSKAGAELPSQRMVATIQFDFAKSGQLSATAINENPLGFLVTSYRVDMEAHQE